jgi:hypothetical protein
MVSMPVYVTIAMEMLANQESDRTVERAPRKARASTRVRQGGRSLGVVEGGADEDQAREDQGEGREAQRKGRGDAERVVDARADVAVARSKKRRGAQAARQLGGAADDHPEIAWTPATASDVVRAHLWRG